MLWMYVSFGTQQSVKLPSFEILSQLCDPTKLSKAASAEAKKESQLDMTAQIAASVNTLELYKQGRYRELIKLLLIDPQSVEEFNEKAEELGIKTQHFPSSMTREDKLKDIQRIVKENEPPAKVPAAEQKDAAPAEKKTEEKMLDPNDIELD